jgi:hypothetical protein
MRQFRATSLGEFAVALIIFAAIGTLCLLLLVSVAPTPAFAVDKVWVAEEVNLWNFPFNWNPVGEQFWLVSACVPEPEMRNILLVSRVTGWIAYTYSRSWRQNPVHGSGDLPYVLDQPHSLTLLATTALGDSWRFGGRFRYTTGNPFTPVDHTVMNGTQYIAIDGPLLSERLPDFVQLDLRLDHAWRRSWGVLDLYIDVQNVTNRDNPEAVTYNKDYTQRSYTTGLPVFPSIGVEYIP